jgi:hypothetical protein
VWRHFNERGEVLSVKDSVAALYEQDGSSASSSYSAPQQSDVVE